MLKTYQYWLLTAIAALSLLLVIVDITLVNRNQGLRAEVESRAQYIQQSIQLQGLYQDMVKALADLAVRNKDDQLRELLTKEGISITVTPPPATPPAGAAKGKQP
jgi:ABC-type transport system involved in cytochrome bd biosynthesis fused ATPase/permease subunit